MAVYTQATSDGDRATADRLGEHFMATGGAVMRNGDVRDL